jgi:nitrate reductase NapD
MSDEMHIAGIVVRAAPTRVNAVRRALGEVPGTEIHAEEDGKLVVTIEAASAVELADRVTGIGRFDGVLSAAPVYHHAEDLEETSR